MHKTGLFLALHSNCSLRRTVASYFSRSVYSQQNLGKLQRNK